MTMQLKHYTFFLLLLTQCSLQAQEPQKADLFPCGTAPKLDPWLVKYQNNPMDFPEDSDDTLYVGVQIHLVGSNTGSGRFANDRLLDAFCRLNEDYAATGIRFYFKNDWNLINNSAWYQHDSVVQGIQMMFQNNVPDALNAYFMSYPAGNCGYNLPYAGVAIGHGCAGPNDHTWAHEVGHALSLPHPFIGWEDKVYNFNDPTPDTLTYDYTHFHSTPDTIVPAPLDTALVEYLDGSNCGIAADRICDTKPDYLSYRWNCNGLGMSTTQQKDPTGATFFSDGSLFMSYANDACQNRFSPDQIQIMRLKLQTDKSNWLAAEAQGGPFTSQTELLTPGPSDNVPASGTLLQWTSSPGATHYVVQVSRLSTFGVKELDLVVTDTFAYTSALLPNISYYWRVRPFNSSFTCTSFTPNVKFTPVVSSVSAAGDAGWLIYPTLLAAGQSLVVEMPEKWVNEPLNCQVFNAAGRLVWRGERQFAGQKETLDLPSQAWAPGIYYLVCTGRPGIVRQSLSILRY